jgi:flavin-binding protein dodecin
MDPVLATGSSMETIEDAINNAVDSAGVDANHLSGEVGTITVDIGGVRGGIEYRVQVRLTG